MNRKNILTLCLCLITAASALAVDSTPLVLPFRVSHGMILVSAVLDGQPKIMVIDTGSEHTMLNDSRNVLHQFTVVLDGKDTTGRSHMVVMPRVPVACISFAGTLQGEALKTTGADGIIGQDILSGFKFVLVDNQAHTITLSNSAPVLEASK